MNHEILFDGGIKNSPHAGFLRRIFRRQNISNLLDVTTTEEFKANCINYNNKTS